MSKKKIEDIEKQIKKLEERRKKEITELKKKERKERTKRLVSKGAFLEAIFGEISLEETRKLIMEMRRISKKTGIEKFKFDELDKKKNEFEELTAAQKKGIKEIINIEKSLNQGGPEWKN